MLEREQYSIELVDSWMTTNLGIIAAAMGETRLGKIKDASDPQSPAFNLERRHLSEMPICDFWGKVDTPAGFRKIHGVVSYPRIEVTNGEFYLHYSSHWFVKSEDLIFCLTPGQFISYLARLEPGPGVRIEALQQRVPGLIRVYDQEKGIAALLGTPEEIFRTLWWEYSAEGEDEKFWLDPMVLIQKYRERFNDTKFKMPHTTR